MGKIVKYMKNSWLAVLAVFALLMLQAYCDLALPSYTSDIVDVGIGQGGITYTAPIKLREQTYQDVSMFMTSDERKIIEEYYRQDENGEYVLTDNQKETLEKIDSCMGLPLVLVSVFSSEQTSQMPEMDMESMRTMYANGMIAEDQIMKIREMALEKMGDMSDSVISTKAKTAVVEEYKQLGIDTGKIQTDYLWATGLKMLGLSVLMMGAAILTGLLASITAAKIGRDLRNRVYQKVVSFSSAEMDQFSTASLITRSTNDIQQVQMVEGLLLRMVLYAPIIGVGGIMKVVATNTGMGWIIGVAVGVISALVLFLVLVAMPKFKMMQTLVDKVNLISREILTGIPVIRAFSREKYEEKRFDKGNMDLMKTQLFTGRVMNFMMPAMMLIMNGITLEIVWFGGKGIEAGNMQVGQMLAC